MSADAARLLGVVGMLPLPLAFVFGFFMGANAAARGRSLQDIQGLLIGGEIALVVLCVGLVFGIGFAVARNPEERAEDRRRRRDYDLDRGPYDWDSRAPARSSRWDEPVYDLGPPPVQPVVRPEVSATISFACRCGQTLQIASQFAGQPVRCPFCQAVQVVPAAAPPPPSPFRAEPR
jgi:hypothetical protein